MPGRASSSSGSTGFISFSGIESALSSLKNFQTCISSGMDTASSVALDLVETQITFGQSLNPSGHLFSHLVLRST
uniref:Uncharacterized protein n=1 Tax=Sus scrofa TaxID=9823 RepID=A0A8D1NJN0_PIG